jgi:heme exporter protein D
VSLGYGWLLRGTYLLMALGALATGLRYGESVPVRDVASAGVALTALAALVVSVQRRRAGVAGERDREQARSARVEAMTGIERHRDAVDADAAEFPPALDMIAPAIGLVGLVAAGVAAGDPAALSVARVVVGAAFLGAVTDAMLLGHWYLVQPGMPRAPLLELIRWLAATWPFEVLVLVWPTGMLSVISGTIDDGYNGILGWMWLACAVTTIVLVGVTRAALKERQYSAVMAATGLLYLAILTAFGTDLVARAVLS